MGERFLGAWGKTATHVLFCASASFFQHVAVSAVSLLLNNPGTRFSIHVITCDPPTEQDDRLRATLAPFAGAELCVHRVNEAVVGGLFVDWRVTKEAYLRLVAPAILPESVERVLYLDSDVLVLADIRPLLETDLGSNIVGAIPDLVRFVLGPDPGGSYVNSGVLLLDLARWRREGITAVAMAYARQHDTYLEYHDQDVINHVLRDRIALLDFRWNMQADVLRFPRQLLGAHCGRIDPARRRPAILHFTGEHKPWLFRSQSAGKRVYFRYRDRTAWRDVWPPGLSRPERLEHRIDRLLLSAWVDRQRIVRIARFGPERLWKRAAGVLWPGRLTTR